MSCYHKGDDVDDDKKEMSEESSHNIVNTQGEIDGGGKMTDNVSRPTKPSLTTWEREERRRESNRLSKRKCRGEKRELLRSYQRQVEQLREEFKELSQENDQLRNELLECLNVKQPAAKLQKVEDKDDDPMKQDIRQAVALAATATPSVIAPTTMEAIIRATVPTTSSLEYKGPLKLPPSLLPFLDTTAATSWLSGIDASSPAGNHNQDARSKLGATINTAGKGGGIISANSYHTTTSLAGTATTSTTINNHATNHNHPNLHLATGAALYSLLTSLQGCDDGESHHHHATPSLSSTTLESNSSSLMLPLNDVMAPAKFPPTFGAVDDTLLQQVDPLLVLRKMISDSSSNVTFAASAIIPPGTSSSLSCLHATATTATSGKPSLTLLQQQLLQQHQHAQAQAQHQQKQQQQKDQRELLALLLQSSSSSSQQQQHIASSTATLTNNNNNNNNTVTTHNNSNAAALELFLQQQDLQLLSFLAGATPQTSATLPAITATAAVAARATTIPNDAQRRLPLPHSAPPPPSSTLDYYGDTAEV